MSSEQQEPHDWTDPARILAKVLRDVLAAETFDREADLKEALKCRCARLRIPYDGDQVARAMDLVESNQPLVTTSTSSRSGDTLRADPVFSRDEAAGWVRQIQARAGLSASMKRMPAARRRNPRVEAIGRALEIVTREIEAAQARCDALEQDDPS